MHHETLIAVLFNEYIAHPIAALFGIHADADHGLVPQHLVMAIIVSVLLISFAFWLRSRLSVGDPGSLQQVLEVFTTGIQGMMREIIGEDFRRHYPLIGSHHSPDSH